MKKYYFGCPSCGNNKDFHRVRESSSGGTGCLILLLGGILPLLLFAKSKLGRIQCGKCGYIFRQPSPPSSPVAKTALSFGILIPFSALLIGYIISTIPYLNEGIPGKKIITWLSDLIANHPSGAGLTLFIYIILSVFFSLLIAVIANYKFRRPLLKEFDYKPFEEPPKKSDLNHQQ